MVSVVVAFYNAEPFLAEAIESVVAQCSADWELLLVDDGSTDRSPAIAHGFERADRRMSYVTAASTNRGTAATRNIGLRLARGELIAPLDGDDVWFPEKLEEQVTLLTAKPEGALLFGQTE
jgi:glycosyltransferase involved in cell wall biosynthesis